MPRKELNKISFGYAFALVEELGLSKNKAAKRTGLKPLTFKNYFNIFYKDKEN